MNPDLTASLNRGLKFAAESDNVPMVEWVFSQGKPTNVDDCLKTAIDKGNTAVITALTQKVSTQPAVVKPYSLVITKYELLMVGSTMTGKNSSFMVTVHMHPEKALRELEAGLISLEEINYQNDEGWTVLMYLCRNANKIAKAENLVQKLIDLGADVNLANNLANKLGSTALTLASNWTRTDSTEKIVEILLQVPNLNVNHPVTGGTTALGYACRDGNKQSTEKTVEMLLNHPQIDVNFQSTQGMTPLMHACEHVLDTSNKKIVEMLVKHPKINLNLKSKLGKSAIAYCPQDALTSVAEIFWGAKETPVN